MFFVVLFIKMLIYRFTLLKRLEVGLVLGRVRFRWLNDVIGSFCFWVVFFCLSVLFGEGFFLA